MAPRSWSSFLRGRLEQRGILFGLCACLWLSGCATGQETKPVFERWPASSTDTTGPYLLALREYLAQPAGQQAAHRDTLRAAAEHSRGAAELEYALALSVDRDDRASLEQARETFEQLLAAPDPLPVALDALVRLQLGQVIDRLERMQASGEIHHAYRAAATERKVCAVNLDQQAGETARLRVELREVRRKLDALARIERTANEQASQREPESVDDAEDDDDDLNMEDR